MSKGDDKTRLAMLTSMSPKAPLVLTSAEQDNTIARARVELFNLAFELSGDEHARLEADVSAWLSADMQRAEMFWRKPEKAVRQALRSQLCDAMAAQGLDMAKLGGNWKGWAHVRLYTIASRMGSDPSSREVLAAPLSPATKRQGRCDWRTTPGSRTTDNAML